MPDAVSPSFYPHLRSRARHLLLWGGRDSTKSDFVALLLLLAAMELPYFKCILLRAVQNTVADSQIATLQKVAEREGLASFFDFRPAALRITCKLNGNSFIGRGTDDMDKVKSVSDPTHVWYEEANQIAGADAEIVSTTLRSSHVGAVIQEVYTFNPDHQGDYREFWLWQKFFRDTGHPDDTTFGGHLAVDVNGRLIRVPFQVVHSTYRNNPWCPAERAATYEDYGTLLPDGQMKDAYRYRVWCLGLWATKQTGNEFYHRFQRGALVKPTPYLPGTSIFTGWDANALPYSAMLCCQLERLPQNRLRLRFFREYTIGPPDSGVRPTARQFLQHWRELYSASDVFVTGDASMQNRKPGEGNATLKKDVLAELLPCLNGGSDRWLKQNPGLGRRRDFVNALFSGFFPDVELWLDPGLTKTINDLEAVQTAADGGKLKVRELDKELGVSYEPLGHLSDVLDYLCCTLLPDKLAVFTKRGQG